MNCGNAMLYQLSYEATDVSGFIAQLVEHRTGIARSRVQTPLKSLIFFFFQASLRNCLNYVHCGDHFFIFIFDIAQTERQITHKA